MYQLDVKEQQSPFSKVVLKYTLEITEVSSCDMNHWQSWPKKSPYMDKHLVKNRSGRSKLFIPATGGHSAVLHAFVLGLVHL